MKSGSDFRQFSKITINFREDPIDIETEAVDVTKDIDANEDLDKFLEEFTGRTYYHDPQSLTKFDS